MSNTDNNSNNITLHAGSNIRGTIMRNHSSDPHFVVKDVYITNEDGDLMNAVDEFIPSVAADHTIIQIPAPRVTSHPSAVWIMKLSGSGGDEALADAGNRGKFLAQNSVISRLDISLSIPAMNFNGVYDVCVVMCSPEHATLGERLAERLGERRYDVVAHGTIRFDRLFGQWTFTWENLTDNTVTDANADTFNSASYPAP